MAQRKLGNCIFACHVSGNPCEVYVIYVRYLFRLFAIFYPFFSHLMDESSPHSQKIWGKIEPQGHQNSRQQIVYSMHLLLFWKYPQAN